MSLLPAADDKLAIEAFASAFDGYGTTAAGESLEGRARAKRRETWEDLRAELFLMSRAERFNAGPPDLGEQDRLSRLYRELLPLFMLHGGTPTPLSAHEQMLRQSYEANVDEEAFGKAWGLKSPQTWWTSLKLNRASSEAALPTTVLSRDNLRAQLESEADAERAALLVLAWGEMQPRNARRFFAADKGLWVDVVVDMRLGSMSPTSAYAEFARRKVAGLGPAYFTKLIYFLHPGQQGVGFIMDQWTATSINLLFGCDVVKMAKVSTTRTKTAVSDRNDGKRYDLFNRLIEQIARSWSASPEHVEMTLFGRGGKAVDLWRRHVLKSLDLV